MRTKPQSQHDAQGFGTKGAGDQMPPLAETLLSGKPLAKPDVREVPKLKARPKPKFGRKVVQPSAVKKWGWSKLGVAIVFLVALCTQLMIAS